jgi:hypothetical protein
VKQFYPNSTFG